MRIDLHVHSSASDGTDTPAEVIRRAAAAALDVIALTDHDTQAGMAQARAALPAGLTLVPGMELSCTVDRSDEQPAAPRYPGQRSVHLLAYLFDPADPELSAETERIRDDRVYRAKGMVTRLRELGVDITWEQVTRIAGDAVVGRPHIARAMAQAGAIARPSDAFTPDWIADGGRAFIDRYAIPVDRAVTLVRAAGGVPVLAHPRSPGYEVPDEVIARLAVAGLAGLEVYHPDHDDSERARLLATASQYGLLVTGGSDDHGTFNNSGLGRDVTPPESYEQMMSFLHQGTAGPSGYERRHRARSERATGADRASPRGSRSGAEGLPCGEARCNGEQPRQGLGVEGGEAPWETGLLLRAWTLGLNGYRRTRRRLATTSKTRTR